MQSRTVDVKNCCVECVLYENDLFDIFCSLNWKFCFIPENKSGKSVGASSILKQNVEDILYTWLTIRFDCA